MGYKLDLTKEWKIISNGVCVYCGNCQSKAYGIAAFYRERDSNTKVLVRTVKKGAENGKSCSNTSHS